MLCPFHCAVKSYSQYIQSLIALSAMLAFFTAEAMWSAIGVLHQIVPLAHLLFCLILLLGHWRSNLLGLCPPCRTSISQSSAHWLKCQSLLACEQSLFSIFEITDCLFLLHTRGNLSTAKHAGFQCQTMGKLILHKEYRILLIKINFFGPLYYLCHAPMPHVLVSYHSPNSCDIIHECSLKMASKKLGFYLWH